MKISSYLHGYYIFELLLNNYSTLIIKLLFKCIILVPKLILSTYLVDNGYIYLLLVNFFYRQVNYLLKY